MRECAFNTLESTLLTFTCVASLRRRRASSHRSLIARFFSPSEPRKRDERVYLSFSRSKMNAAIRFFLVCTIIPCLQVDSIRPAQSAGVSGQLFCSGVPAAGVKVKLFDVDRKLSSSCLKQYIRKSGVILCLNA